MRRALSDAVNRPVLMLMLSRTSNQQRRQRQQRNSEQSKLGKMGVDNAHGSDKENVAQPTAVRQEICIDIAKTRR